MPFLPRHHYASVPLAASPATVCDRLLADPDGVVQRATAGALTAMGPHLCRWGLRISALPTTTARAANPDRLGGVEVVGSGPEDDTGKPQLELALLIEAGTGGSRLAILSTREPDYDLSVPRIDKHPRDQILRSAGR